MKKIYCSNIEGDDILKRAFTIIISAIIICLTGLGIIGYFVEQGEENNAAKTEKSVSGEEAQGIILDGNSLDIYKIEGFTPGGQVKPSDNNDLNTNLDDVEVKDSTKNNSDETTEVGGMTLPYTPAYKDMEIISIGSYDGKFVEDGSDTKKSNVLAMVIKNTSDKVIDYGQIVMKISGQNEGITFQLSNLKPGAAALVMESSGQVEFNEDDKYIYLDSRNDLVDEMPLMENDIKIAAKKDELTVENLSDKNLKTVYVYYKTVDEAGCYLGGITYRTKFDRVTAGKSVTAETIHFSKKSSEIIMVESVKE